jgi:hypothetical protein
MIDSQVNVLEIEPIRNSDCCGSTTRRGSTQSMP